MNISRFITQLSLLLIACATLVACSKDIVVQAHDACTELKVGDEKVGTLLVGDEKKVTISGYGATEVTWVNSDGTPVEDTIWGEDVDSDNAVWHLFKEYGSLILPEDDKSSPDGEADGGTGNTSESSDKETESQSDGTADTSDDESGTDEPGTSETQDTGADKQDAGNGDAGAGDTGGGDAPEGHPASGL